MINPRNLLPVNAWELYQRPDGTWWVRRTAMGEDVPMFTTDRAEAIAAFGNMRQRLQAARS